MPSTEWIANNGFAVFFAVALLFIFERRLGSLNHTLERLSLQVAIMLDRSAHAAERTAEAAKQTATATEKVVETTQRVEKAVMDGNHT